MNKISAKRNIKFFCVIKHKKLVDDVDWNKRNEKKKEIKKRSERNEINKWKKWITKTLISK